MALKDLRSHNNSKIKAVGDAFYEAFRKSLNEKERSWIESIEDRRTFLMNSKEELTFVDFGAGSPNSKRTQEDMDKGVNAIMSISERSKGSTSKFWGIFLFKLIKKLKPKTCVELGSCVGISAAYQAAALKEIGKGTLHSLEGSPLLAGKSRETLRNLGLENSKIVTGPFHKTLEKTLISISPIDYLFNDGHHDQEAVLKYFNLALPYLSNEAVIVFDDINWSQGMEQAWDTIKCHKSVSASIQLKAIGIIILRKNNSNCLHFRIPI